MSSQEGYRIPKLTIIIPVYNGEKYLDRCLESILTQTFQDYEVIIINDGSTDKSGKMLEEYATLNSKIKIIHQNNTGQSMARKSGLKEATGDYIGFIDIDDWIAVDMYEHLVEIIEVNNCDIAAMGICATDKYKDYIKVEERIRITEKEDVLYEYLHRGVKNSSDEYSLSNKIYKIDLFEGVGFDESNYGEDYLINFKLLNKSKRMVRSSKIGYFYYQRHDSTIHGRVKAKDLYLLENCKKVLNLSHNTNNEKVIYLAELQLARSYFSLLSRGILHGFENDMNNSDLRMLQTNFNKNYFKLVTSNEIPFNRKVIMTILLIFNILRLPISRGNKKGDGK